MKIEPASRDDIAAYYGGPLPVSVRAFVAKDNDKTIAIGGVFRNDGRVVFFGDITDEMRKKYPVAMYKTARKIMSMQTVEVVSLPDKEVEASQRFLERLGFKQTDGDMMTWQPSQPISH